MSVATIDFLGLPLTVGIDAEAVCAWLDSSEARFVSFINPAAWALARRDAGYRAALNDVPVVLPDGIGVVAAARVLTGRRAMRVSFDMSSLAGRFFEKLVATQKSLMLVGGQPAVDEAMQIRLEEDYPGLRVVGTAHGYGEVAQKVAAVMKAQPDVVVIGMGAPRQEMLLVELRRAGYKGFAISCGGFFDQYLVKADYYPVWIDHLNLRFVWRFLKEPRRLWRRYLLDYPVFVGAVLYGCFRQKRGE